MVMNLCARRESRAKRIRAFQQTSGIEVLQDLRQGTSGSVPQNTKAVRLTCFSLSRCRALKLGGAEIGDLNPHLIVEQNAAKIC